MQGNFYNLNNHYIFNLGYNNILFHLFVDFYYINHYNFNYSVIIIKIIGKNDWQYL